MPRLVDAYRHGIFPWFSEGQPILWWSTDPRMVLYTDALRVSHTLRKRLRKIARDPAVEIRCDSAFERVMRACAAPRSEEGGTWIVPDMVDAYLELHRCGIAHSVETWMDGELAGGLYGLSIGRMFFGESMFAARPDASKIALVYLVDFVKKRGFTMLDCQQETAHLATMGAHPIPRERFLEELGSLVDAPGIARWPPRLFLSPYDKARANDFGICGKRSA